MDCSEILNEACRLVSGDRAKTHGDKKTNHDNIGALWNAYLTRLLKTEIELTADQVAVMVALLKIARTLAGSHNLDDYVDGSAYIAIAGEIADARSDADVT